MDDFFSDSDNEDTDKSNQKMEKRLNSLIDKIVGETGCTYDQALEQIAKNPKVLQSYNVNPGKIKKWLFTSLAGRNKMKKKLYEWTLDEIPHQTQLAMILQLYSGYKSREKQLKNYCNHAWPEYILFLYILQIGDWEMEKLNSGNNNNNGKNKEKLELNYLRKERNMMKKVFMDCMFLSKSQDMRSFVMNLLEELLNPRRNAAQLPFYKLYKRSRSILLSDNNQIQQNFIWHYNNKSKNWKNNNNNNNNNNTYAGVTINTNGNGKNDNNNNNNNNGSGTICPYFNGPRGCSFRNRCRLRNICFHCKSGRHGVLGCFTVARLIVENGTLQRYYSTRPMAHQHDPRNLVVVGIDGTVYYLDPARYGNGNVNNGSGNGKSNKKRQ